MTSPGRHGAVGRRNPFAAIVTGLADLLERGERLDPAGDDERLDGKTALVTGASSGLGKAVAIDLARRGARVLMACRSRHGQTLRDVERASGRDQLEVLAVDLADLRQVDELCDQLRDRRQRIDIAVLNAGLMPVRARRTPQGFEVMFAVHFLANRLMVQRMLDDEVIQPNAEPGARPRMVFVSSETHKSARPIDFDRFGAFVDYGVMDGLAEYGRTKLHLTTLAVELSRRLNPEGEPVRIGVHALCPGPIASNIAREAPSWLRPVIQPVLRRLFRAPEVAAQPVILLAGGRVMEGRTGEYLHMLRRKPVSPLASDPLQGRRLWEASAELLERHRAETSKLTSG